MKEEFIIMSNNHRRPVLSTFQIIDGALTAAK